jgi:serine/threonine-protein kinase
VLIIASAALLVIAAVAVFIVFRPGGRSSSSQAVPATSISTPSAAVVEPPPSPSSSEGPTAATTPGDTQSGVSSTVPPTPTDEASAQAALQQQVSADSSSVEQLVGSWVPELSAKKVGLVVNGVTFDYQAILADYQQQAAAHPGALLLRSDDYTNFKLSGFWITVAPQSFNNPADANSWCDSQNIDANDCFAERIMHTGNYQGNTVYRG